MSVVRFAQIMLFYAVLACIVGPALFYVFGNRSLKNAGNGFVAGSIVSIILWFTYGRKLV
jgi:hypothetical protein